MKGKSSVGKRPIGKKLPLDAIISGYSVVFQFEGDKVLEEGIQPVIGSYDEILCAWLLNPKSRCQGKGMLEED